MLYLTYASHQDHDMTSRVQDAPTNETQVVETNLEEGSYVPLESSF